MDWNKEPRNDAPVRGGKKEGILFILIFLISLLVYYLSPFGFIGAVLVFYVLGSILVRMNVNYK